jgi:hypothetical protein
LCHDQWVNLPDATAICGHAPDPSNDLVRRIESDAADPVGRERFNDLLTRGVEVLPRFGSSDERIMKQGSCVLDEVRSLLGEIDDANVHQRRLLTRPGDRRDR